MANLWVVLSIDMPTSCGWIGASNLIAVPNLHNMSMLTNDLWIKNSRTITKVAYQKVGNDYSSWEADLLKALHQEAPYVSGRDITISINRKDPEQGTAVGKFQLKKNLSIPFIIKEYKVMSLDLLQYNDELHPLNKRNLDTLLGVGGLGKSVKNNFPKGGGAAGFQNATRVPHLGKYAMAAMVDSSEETIQGALGQAFSDMELRFLMGVPDVADTLGRYTEFSKQASEFVQEVTGVETSDALEIPLNIAAPQGGSRAGEVNTTTGVQAGLLVDEVITFGGTSLDKVAFVGVDGAFALEDQIVHVPLGTAESKCVTLDNGPVAGTGIFIKLANDGGALSATCTAPFTVVATLSDGGSRIKDTFGVEHTLHHHADLGGMQKIASDVYVGGDWHFVPTSDCTIEYGMDICAKLEAEMVKEAEEVGDYINPLSVDERKALMGCLLSLTPELCKEAAVREEERKTTVDAILGLNFLTKQRTTDIAAALPILEQANQALAKMLLAGNLGMRLDTKEIKVAVFAVDRVIRDLKQFKQVTPTE